ncbi:hypothetical protein ALC53_04493, partial [Atta colombica]
FYADRCRNENVMKAVLSILDFSKAFNTVNSELLTVKLHHYGLCDSSL